MVRKLQKSPGDTRYSNGSTDSVDDNRREVLDQDERKGKGDSDQKTPQGIDWEKAWKRSDDQKYDLMCVVRDAYTILFELSDKDLTTSTPKEMQLHGTTLRVVAAFLKKAYDDSI